MNKLSKSKIHEKEEIKQQEKDSFKNLRGENDNHGNNDNEFNSGKWTDEEHRKFLEGLI